MKKTIAILVAILILILGGWWLSLEHKEEPEAPKRLTPSFTRSDAYILLELLEVGASGKELSTAFSLSKENYICTNTQEHPTIKNRRSPNKYSSSKEIYCGNYYLREQYHDDTGPLLRGPFYDGDLNSDDCPQEAVSDACYYVTATRADAPKVCENIDDSLWRERCKETVALNTENIGLCSDLSDELKRECYNNFNKFHEPTDELCKKLNDFDASLGSDCYEALSKIKSDILICNKIEVARKRDNCIMTPIDWEYMKDSYDNLEKIDCSKIKDEQDREKCVSFMEKHFSE